MEEVSYLSSINAQLEEKISSQGSLVAEALTIRRQKDALLVLLGEKEEELQAAMADNIEVKTMYQMQIKELLNQVAPEETQTKSLETI